VRVLVEVMASDDYGITDAHLVATVAKGTGEAVKFREQKIAFDTDAPGDNGSRRFIKTLDLLALGLEPGDELYFHVEAADNRQPTSNRARSETRFIVLKGPEQTVGTPGAGVAGVNLVPEYFRSQRQIIIDTEKLIRDRPTLHRPSSSNGRTISGLTSNCCGNATGSSWVKKRSRTAMRRRISQVTGTTTAKVPADAGGSRGAFRPHTRLAGRGDAVRSREEGNDAAGARRDVAG
jgi:hypothetical protein